MSEGRYLPKVYYFKIIIINYYFNDMNKLYKDEIIPEEELMMMMMGWLNALPSPLGNDLVPVGSWHVHEGA